MWRSYRIAWASLMVAAAPGCAGAPRTIKIPESAVVPPPKSGAKGARGAVDPYVIKWTDGKRVFEIDVLRCPDCSGRMRLIAAITDASVAQRILG